MVIGKSCDISELNPEQRNILDTCHFYESEVLPVFYQRNHLFSWLHSEYDYIVQYFYLEDDNTFTLKCFNHYGFNWNGDDHVSHKDALEKCYQSITSISNSIY